MSSLITLLPIIYIIVLKLESFLRVVFHFSQVDTYQKIIREIDVLYAFRLQSWRVSTHSRLRKTINNNNNDNDSNIGAGR